MHARLVGLRDIQRASQQLPRKDKCNKWFHSDNDRERELRKEASRAHTGEEEKRRQQERDKLLAGTQKKDWNFATPHRMP